ncbi:hypothetical protein BGW42_008462 [Actinomortierella wolfii]|nr:hypothetical protein BGW42_008462 [Actinomortierella wolfii]
MISAIVNDLRNGLGAVRLRSDVKKISLAFSRKADNAGARYFLKENMPRLQYNNPQIQFEVTKVKDTMIPPEVTVEFASNTTQKISCSKIQSSEICKKLLSITTEGSSPSA